MENPLLTALGVRVHSGVIPIEICDRLRTAMVAAEGSASLVYDDAGTTSIEDRSIRRSFSVSIERGLDAELRTVLDRLHPVIEHASGERLAPPPTYEYLRYGPGDRFIAHTDARRDDSENFDPSLAGRRVSVVAFIDDHHEEPSAAGYGGGRLLFRAFEDDDALSTVGFGVEQHAGSVVTFPSHLWHEVSPVTWGTRLTVVGWYLRA